METINSFKGYGKVDGPDQRETQKKARRRILLIIISAVVLLVIVIAAVAATIVHNHHASKSSSSASSNLARSLKSVCSVTQYPDTCFSSISPLQNSSDPRKIFAISLQVAAAGVKDLLSVPSTYTSKLGDNSPAKAALHDCNGLFGDAGDHLNDSVNTAASSASKLLTDSSTREDLRTWLSTAITDLDTCFDGLSALNGTAADVADELRSVAKNSTEFVSNSLAIVTKFSNWLAGFKGRKLLGDGGSVARAGGGGEWPEWVGAGERRLLQTANPTPNIVVAQDGSGDYKTISAAINAVPAKSASRFVIYVKAGTYVENVLVGKNFWNVMMYGDGMAKTVVSGSLNFVDGTPTFSTATFAVNGQRFIAKSMGFKNTAGAAKHQAVAFRSGSDQSVYFQCLFDGFQDTLYTYTNRQFYRECTVTGTIDFIFGNAAVVFQDCNIQPRQPLANQFNTITAQGKVDPNQNTGTSIQKCTVAPLDQFTAQTYLGRPWKAYSTTVFMQSSIGLLVNPQGWIEWIIGTVPSSTIFYGEYLNTGAGSSTSQRVNWTGVYSALTVEQASTYTVSSLLGTSWLSESKVAFDSSL
ncbi:hypothetical protein Dimus_003823 [Dionaea muscipula]